MGLFVHFLLSEGVCIYNKMSALFNNRYECPAFLDGINPLYTKMTITNRLRITISPLMLHGASSVRFPTSTHSFRTLLPTVRIRPLNLFSASSVDLHGASNTYILRNNLRVKLSPIKSPVLRKYPNLFKRPSMYSSILRAMSRVATVVNIYVQDYYHFICEW